MKSKSIVLMIVSLGFGLIAAIGISQVMGNNGPQAEPTVERGQVIIASIDLKVGDDLTEENVSIEHWPVEVIPPDACRDLEQIKHKKITTRLRQSMPIIVSDTINKSDWDQVDIPAGYKLVALKVSAEDSINGLLQPGNRVDIIGVVNVRSNHPNSNGQTEVVSETFLKNIEVYSVDGRLRNTGTIEANGGNVIVGVLVTEQQSELIVLVQKVAKLRLVLRGESEESTDSEQFTDYSEFYNSVFGNSEQDGDESGDESDDADPEAETDTFSTRVWGSGGYSEVKFIGSKRVTPAKSSSSFVSDDNDDSDDYDQSDEIESGLEEDQYPGE